MNIHTLKSADLKPLKQRGRPNNYFRSFLSSRCLQNCKKKRISAVKLAYSGGIRGLDDPEVLKRVTYQWKLYEAPERGRLNRIRNDEWKPVSTADYFAIL